MNIQTAETKTKETFFMTEADSLKERTFTQLVAKTINGTQAAEILGLSTRQVRRMKRRFGKKGLTGILHSGRGKISNHALSKHSRKEIVTIIKSSYPDFGPTLATEKLSELHEIYFSNETIRKIMIEEEIWKVRVRVIDHFPHVWRVRKDCFGEMEQYDGSHHNWFEGRLQDAQGACVMEQCLLAAMDDARGTITKAQFAPNEGVMATFTFWQQYVKTNGRPVNIYLDRGSTYKNTPKKNTVNEIDLTQFERACQQVGIKLIHARSPQAKGRIERLFQTLQDRLVKEMRLRNICTIEEANTYLTEIFIPRFNKTFAVVTKKQTDLHTVMTEKELAGLPAIMSIHDQRNIMDDYTVMHQTKLYQVNPWQSTLVRTGDKVTVQTRTGGQVFIFKGASELQFTEILERPKKVILAKGPDRRRIGHAPKPNHPWKLNSLKSLLLKNPVLTR
jgi:transposase